MSILETLNSTKLFERYQDEGDIKIFINSVRMMSHNSTESTFTTVRPIVIQRGTTTELNPEFNIVVKESLKRLITHGKYYVIVFKQETSTYESITGPIQYHPSSLKVIKNENIINRLKEIEQENIEEYNEDILF